MGVLESGKLEMASCQSNQMWIIQAHFLLYSVLFLLGTVAIDNAPIGADYGIRELNRSSFPSGFIFGTASSAYQVTSSVLFLEFSCIYSV